MSECLEEFMELIEKLPTELRDRLAELRDDDLRVESATTDVERRISEFFQNAANLDEMERKRCYNQILTDYSVAMQTTDKKVSLATLMHSCVERYLWKLEEEIKSCKRALEVDDPDITAKIEKRVLEEERSRFSQPTEEPSGRFGHVDSVKTPPRAVTLKSVRAKKIKSATARTMRPSILLDFRGKFPVRKTGAKLPMSAHYLKRFGQPLPPRKRSSSSVITLSDDESASSTSSTFVGFTAASRVTSVKSPVPPPVSVITASPEGSLRSTTISLSSANESPPARKRPRKDSFDIEVESRSSERRSTSASAVPAKSEPRYCVCDYASYGKMVACDSEDCPHEWFHFPCVGLKKAPKGNWFCPDCSRRQATM